MKLKRSEGEQRHRAQERFEWKDSRERSELENEDGLIALMIFVIGVVAGIVFAIIDLIDKEYPSNVIWTGWVAVVGSAIALGVVLRCVVWLRLRRDFRARRIVQQDLKNLQDEEEKAASGSADGKIDLASLWQVNQKRIDHYHEVASVQARNSFGVTQIATSMGFLVLVAAGAAAAFAKTTPGAITAGAIGIIGAGLSAYITTTFMRTQQATSRQFQTFFAQPVEFARLLGAERLITSTLTDPKDRSAAVLYVIQSMTAQTPGAGSEAGALPSAEAPA